MRLIKGLSIIPYPPAAFQCRWHSHASAETVHII